MTFGDHTQLRRRAIDRRPDPSVAGSDGDLRQSAPAERLGRRGGSRYRTARSRAPTARGAPMGVVPRTKARPIGWFRPGGRSDRSPSPMRRQEASAHPAVVAVLAVLAAIAGYQQAFLREACGEVHPDHHERCEQGCEPGAGGQVRSGQLDDGRGVAGVWHPAARSGRNERLIPPDPRAAAGAAGTRILQIRGARPPRTPAIPTRRSHEVPARSRPSRDQPVTRRPLPTPGTGPLRPDGPQRSGSGSSEQAVPVTRCARCSSRRGPGGGTCHDVPHPR